MMASYAEWLLQATIVLGCAAAAGVALRRRSAVAHLLWAAAFVGLILLPVLSGIVGPRLFLGIGSGAEAIAPTAWQGPATPLGYADAAPIASGSDVSQTASSGISLSLEGALLAVWAVGFLLALGRTLFCLGRLSVLRRKATRPVKDSDLQIDANGLARRVGLRRNWEVRICVSSKPGAAMTWGFLRPVILLPKGAEAWSRERLEAVLLHEFAHVRRNDFASQLLAELACALYWFHPLAWLGARSMRESAELATDDAVLRSGVKATSYAAELLHLAAELGKRSSSLQTGVHFMSKPKIESRIRSILSPSARRRGLSSIQLLAVVVVAALSVSAIAGLRTGKKPQDAGTQAESASVKALKNAKALMTATNIYWCDHDDRLPHAKDTAAAKGAIEPYVLDRSVFESPNVGGKFVYNVNLSGVSIAAVQNPSEVPVWVEQLPAGQDFAVGFLDGHAETVPAKDRPKIDSAMASRYPLAQARKQIEPDWFYVVNPRRTKL